jgi:asparagine synthase (glutamine-hydrolysing)
MCGIAGILQATFNSSSPEQIKKMTDTLSHRGPEGDGFWQNTKGTVTLGHRRLSIIDLSKEAAQPMKYSGRESFRTNGPDRYVIVHNGEIYNYVELKHELAQHGYQFSTHSDTEVILAAYDYWNEDCVDHFDGMFAFAIWDEEERELFAARDRFGEKPFFYAQQNGRFFFASEMKALWSAGIPRQANLKMLFNYITIGYVDNPERPEETFFEGILKLPPASRLFYSPETQDLEIEQYWSIDLNKQDHKITDEAAIEKFGYLFRESVKRRLRSDVAVGTSLSGGLDSSSVVAMAASLHPDGPGLNAFTAVFPGFEKDEQAHAEKIARQFRLTQHLCAPTASGFVQNWQRLLYHQEEPLGSASAFVQFAVFELAGQKGVTVLLDGQGADETLAGYHRYYKWYWQELFQRRKLGRSGEITAARRLGVTEKFGIRNVMASLLPDLASVILEHRYLAYALRHEDLSPEFVKMQSKEAYYSTPGMNDLNAALHFNTFTHGLEELLRYADRNSMAHGREVRLPFLYHELVEFLFTLPSRFKIREGWTKWLLRTAMTAKLPPEITWRKDKIGFEPPQQQWMLDPTIEQMIRDARNKLALERIIRPTSVDKPIHASSAYDSNNNDWRYLCAAAIL